MWVGGGGVGGQTEIINTRNNIRYDIRLSIYSDKMGPEEVERRIVVEEKTNAPYIFDFAIKLICDTLH